MPWRIVASYCMFKMIPVAGGDACRGVLCVSLRPSLNIEVVFVVVSTNQRIGGWDNSSSPTRDFGSVPGTVP